MQWDFFTIFSWIVALSSKNLIFMGTYFCKLLGPHNNWKFFLKLQNLGHSNLGVLIGSCCPEVISRVHLMCHATLKLHSNARNWAFCAPGNFCHEMAAGVDVPCLQFFDAPLTLFLCVFRNTWLKSRNVWLVLENYLLEY